MYKSFAGVVSPDRYQVGNAYPIEQVGADFLAQLEALRKKSIAKPEATKPTPIDPEVLKMRAEAQKLLDEAQQRLAESRQTAESLVREAQTEIEQQTIQARQEAYAEGLTRGSTEGYDEGLKKGEEEGLGHWAELLGRWQGLLDATVDEKKHYLADRERILVELSLKISAKILAHEIQAKPEDVAFLVREAIRKASDKANLIVRLNPDDLNRVLEAGGAGLKGVAGIKQIEFLADESIMKGGVRLQSGSETIDAGLETQLAEIAKGLLEEAYHAD